MDTKTTMDTCWHIPMNIMLDILKRLPIKSLGRFNSVCKQWYPWYVCLILPSRSGIMLLKTRKYVMSIWLIWDYILGPTVIGPYAR